MVIKTLFSGSRFIFWALAPLLLLCAVVLTSFASHKSFLQSAGVAAIDLFILLLVIGLYNPRQNEWALRSVTGIVFLLYVGYWTEEIREGRWVPDSGRGIESVLAATLGVLVIGYPCLRFMWKGFRGLKQDSQDVREIGDDHSDDDGSRGLDLE